MSVARDRLTRREREMLLLLCEGLSLPQIARRLWLSNWTVRTHVANLRDKLGDHCSGTAPLVVDAYARGILTADDLLKAAANLRARMETES